MNKKIITTILLITILLSSAYVSAIDTLEFDTEQGLTPSIVHVNGDVYAIAYSGPDDDGFIKTVSIDPTGLIQETPIQFEFDATRGVTPDIIHFRDNIYAITYSGNNEYGFLKTIQISSDGTNINTIDSWQFENIIPTRNPKIIKVNENYAAIVYGDQGTLKTFRIKPDGTLDKFSSVTNKMTYNFDTICKTPKIINVCNDIYAIVYTGNGEIGYLITVSITPDGQITQDKIGTLALGNKLADPCITHVSGDIYAIVYGRSGDRGLLSTVSISPEGTIISPITTLEFYQKKCIKPNIIKINDNIFAVAYSNSRNNGLLKTFMIDSADYSISQTDSYEYVSIGKTPDIINADNNIYAIAYTGVDDDGFLKTVLIDPSGSITIDIKTRDVEPDEAYEIAGDKNRDPTDGYEFFYDPDGSSKAIVSIDGDSDVKIDHFICIDSDDIPEKYWDPDHDILVDVIVEDIDDDVTNEWIFDKDGNGVGYSYYDPNDGLIHLYETFTLTISVVGNGKVEKNPDKTRYLRDTSVELTAVPDSDWRFDHWSGALSGSTNPEHITMDSDNSVTAYFIEDAIPVYYDLVISVDGSGTTDPAPGTYSYLDGSTVYIDPIADSCWSFDHWSGDIPAGDEFDDPLCITMDSGKSIVANFVINYYSLDISVVGNGMTNPAPGVYSYSCGSVVDLSVATDPGWVFDHWEGTLSGSNNPASILIDGDKVVTAYLVQEEYTLSTSIVGSGTINKNPEQATYTYGTVVELTAIPSVGWHFIGWSGDLSSLLNPASITMDGDKSVSASFAVDEFTIVASAGSNGVISPSGSVVVGYGGSQLFTFTPNVGYHVLDVVVDGVSQGALGSYLFSNVVANHVIGVSFAVDPDDPVFYNLMISLDGNGITNPGAGTYSYLAGTIVNLEAIADPGWSFDHWSGDLTGYDNPIQIIINSDKSVVATFIDIDADDDGIPDEIDDDDDNDGYLDDYEIACGSDPKDPAITPNDTDGDLIPDCIDVDDDNDGYADDVDVFPLDPTEWFDTDGDGVGDNADLDDDGDGWSDVDEVLYGTDPLDASDYPIFYNLIISVNGDGYTAPNTGVYSYLKDSIIDVEAIANPGWTFDHWSGDVSVGDEFENPLPITIEANITAIAHFVQLTYTLSVTVSGDGSGTVEYSPDNSYHSGDIVTYVYRFFKGWNLITLPLHVTNNSFTALFNGLNCVNFCYGWNGTTQTPEIVETLLPGQAYWIYVYDNVDFGIQGTSIIEDLSLVIYPGDTLLGWVHPSATTAEHICQAIPQINSVAIPIYSAADPSNISYLIHTAGNTSNNFLIEQGMGFWVRTAIGGVWDGNVENNSYGPYHYGDVVTLWANASVSSVFTGWSGGLSGSISPMTITIDGNKVVTATFAQNNNNNNNNNNNENNNNQENNNQIIIVNQKPTANAGGPYNGYTNQIIIFNASKSRDPDGDKIEYRWDFDGDGKYDTEWSKNAITSHIYSSAGNYIVKLEVRDSKGANSTNQTLASIEFKANNPPTNLIVKGPLSGKKNIEYIYTAIATDIDPNDMLRFIFNWGDGTNDTTGFVSSGVAVNVTHSWSSYGVYVLTVYAQDASLNMSEKKSLTVLIDVIVIDDKIKGYLIDENSDGIYDLFYNNENKNSNSVETKDNITYLINSDEDEEWDYQYNISTQKLTEYKKDKKSDLQDKKDVLNLSVFGVISLIIGAILLLLIVILYKNKDDENFEVINKSEEAINTTNDQVVEPKKIETKEKLEEISPKADQMELKEYKNKQKDPVFRWKEQIRFENIATQVIFNDKSNESNNSQKKPAGNKARKSTSKKNKGNKKSKKTVKKKQQVK